MNSTEFLTLSPLTPFLKLMFVPNPSSFLSLPFPSSFLILFLSQGSLIPALSAACKQGDLDVARHLVKKKGADVNIQDVPFFFSFSFFSFFSLFLSFLFSLFSFPPLLLTLTIQELGLAPLHHASESGHHKIIKFLLSVDANPNIQTEVLPVSPFFPPFSPSQYFSFFLFSFFFFFFLFSLFFFFFF